MVRPAAHVAGREHGGQYQVGRVIAIPEYFLVLDVVIIIVTDNAFGIRVFVGGIIGAIGKDIMAFGSPDPVVKIDRRSRCLEE